MKLLKTVPCYCRRNADSLYKMLHFLYLQAFSHVQIILGSPFVNQTTYYKIQYSVVVPTIHEHYAINIGQAWKEAQDTNKVVLGDVRFDSPGKCAKYCTYPLQSPITKIFFASVTLQKDSGKGSASLELKGLQECLQDLSNVGCTINVIATDRNRQIAKWIREELPEVAHKFDLWHFVKNIKAKH